jgi:uncharacterized protein YehS (DUF1456 family)
MINNDVPRSIRFMLDLSDATVIETVKLADPDVAIEDAQVKAFLKKEDDPDRLECSDLELARPDGLVVHCRGKNESQTPRPIANRITDKSCAESAYVSRSN